MKRIFIKNVIIFLLILNVFVWGVGAYTNFAGYQLNFVMSGSMEPAIMTHDMIILDENRTFDSVEIGDVIIFKYKGKQIVHRAIERVNIDGVDYLKTKGDNNEKPDPLVVTKDNFCGVIKKDFRVPYVGYIAKFLP